MDNRNLKVVGTGATHYELRATVDASSVEEPLADAKAIISQASVNITVVDRTDHDRVLGVAKSGTVTDNTQNTQASQAKAVEKAVTALLDAHQDLFGQMTITTR
jgi:hypothetical protein